MGVDSSTAFLYYFRLSKFFWEVVMKVIKSLCLLSLALFPLAPAGVGGLQQAAPAEPQCVSGAEQNSCGRCGDGYCAKQCGENETSCPKDCGSSY
jgi:hypothetical protein